MKFVNDEDNDMAMDTPYKINGMRRSLIKAAGALGIMSGGVSYPVQGQSFKSQTKIELVSTTATAAWKKTRLQLVATPMTKLSDVDVMILVDKPFQTIEGFGACFNELGWLALSKLSPSVREGIMEDLFAPEIGLNLNVCRMPIGANDYARSWYSYNETPGDFEMRGFDLTHDDEIQVPFIKAAQRYNPDLKLWASPWSPPTWMKRNGHYALARTPTGVADNGLRLSQKGEPGKDMFIQDDRYLQAYALYSRKFVEGYRARGITVSTVMPQNEFNSIQPFPSCTWTPEGLARFIPFLGAEMERVNVDVFFGTLERPDPAMFETVMANEAARRFIKGIGVQWAGRGAVPFIHHSHPNLPVYQSEQGCGDGKNDWRYARYTWSLMKDFMRAGVGTYNYWNIALLSGGVSTWGWAQNSLISVNAKTAQYKWNHDYYIFKHLSHFVRPGARRIDTLSYSGYENLLAFINPNGSIVIAVQNDLAQEQRVRFGIGGKVFSVMLPADSLNTLVV